MLVYDITNDKSFEQVRNYYSKEIKNYCKENTLVVLLGNKSDLENERKINSETAANFAVKKGYIFMETSCEKNKNVADAFTTLIEKTNIRMKKYGESNNKINKNEESNTKMKKYEQLNNGMKKKKYGSIFKIFIKTEKKKKKKKKKKRC